MNIAVVAVAYNRIDSLSRLLASLEKANYDQEVTLIISVDKSKTDSVERFADSYIWPHGEKIVDKHEKNLGLRPHMMSLGKWFDSFDAIVVLEDDIVVSPSFFYYTKQAVSQYYDNPNVAGISLYGVAFNGDTNMPFMPLKDEYDAYFMNKAISWGEVWMRDSWRRYNDWYLEHQDFPILSHLPYRICLWGNKSWLKYHTRYCIEENKYFVFPYISLSTNYGDAGEHSKGGGDTMFQVSLQQGVKKEYKLPKYGDEGVYYDGFFENKAVYQILGLDTNNLCLDLNGEWKNRLNKRYWLTTEIRNFKILKAFGLNFRPIEVNVLTNNPGHQIFLYDTQSNEKNPYKNNNSTLLYFYNIQNAFSLIKQYGFKNVWKDFVKLLKQRVGV